ncbi:hypothetical protein [Tunturiibacter gelidoferens]|uniref:Uncharacterized protein n=1 Tax=Tunturiibacter gelidiferens TaxID=3069689 RepID=A0A9X0QKE4_9BACT|nr:hypothetical protein [Edaphobacter lichenicola]MBB5331784.1 hypothetical protein [Edaphobacter lichenicola]
MIIPIDDNQLPMPPNTVTVSDPVVTGVDPVPDEIICIESSKEGYSEGGLSGEATADTEPFLSRKRTDEEIADYDERIRVWAERGTE